MTTRELAHFRLFRVVFGAYLMWHFDQLFSHATELFGDQGMLPNGMRRQLGWFEAEMFLTPRTLIACGTSLSLLFLIGAPLRCVWAFLLWCIWTGLFNAMPLISNPGLPYVGFLLLCCAVVPHNQGIPRPMYYVAWFLMALGYTVSGVHKLQCETWRDGTAIWHVMHSPLARDIWLRDVLVTYAPAAFWKFTTWSSLALEIAFLPLGCFHHTRRYMWAVMVAMHLGILALVNFTDLTLGVLMIHLFTYDTRW